MESIPQRTEKDNTGKRSKYQHLAVYLKFKEIAQKYREVRKEVMALLKDFMQKRTHKDNSGKRSKHQHPPVHLRFKQTAQQYRGVHKEVMALLKDFMENDIRTLFQSEEDYNTVPAEHFGDVSFLVTHLENLVSEFLLEVDEEKMDKLMKASKRREYLLTTVQQVYEALYKFYQENPTKWILPASYNSIENVRQYIAFRRDEIVICKQFHQALDRILFQMSELQHLAHL